MRWQNDVGVGTMSEAGDTALEPGSAAASLKVKSCAPHTARQTVSVGTNNDV